MGAVVLNSWKQIAEYVGRGVRTVQRWERELGLPVRRPRKHPRSPIIAISTEIDQWIRSGGTKKAGAKGNVVPRAELGRVTAQVLTNVQRVRRSTELTLSYLEQLMQARLTIETEIRTGRTLARIALDSDSPKKTARNTANARKAYDTARRWAERALLTPAESKEIANQLELLKAELAKLEKRS